MLRPLPCLAFLFNLCARPVVACDLALLLALDISGSVDPREYEIQRDGLAAALRDATVTEALVRARAQVSVMQWTGSSRQKITIPWTEVGNFVDAETLAARVSSDARVWRNYSTAIGEALQVAIPTFATVPSCKRRVIDISGDGTSNEGVEPAQMRAALRAANITVNALVIETDDADLTGYFWENVISGPEAFVVTADGFEAYADRIKHKLLREVTKQLAARD